MERDDRCLYLFATSLRDKVKSGDKKDVTDAETVILKEFLENYVMVRLTNMFFIDVSEPILTILNHFESEDPIIHKRWHTLADFFSKFLSKFMKNAGDDKSPINELLDIDFTVSKNQLSDQDIFLGGKVESFLKELTVSSCLILRGSPFQLQAPLTVKDFWFSVSLGLTVTILLCLLSLHRTVASYSAPWLT